MESFTVFAGKILNNLILFQFEYQFRSLIRWKRSRKEVRALKKCDKLLSYLEKSYSNLSASCSSLENEMFITHKEKSANLLALYNRSCAIRQFRINCLDEILNLARDINISLVQAKRDLKATVEFNKVIDLLQ
jgi:hypothetical protein